MKIFIIKIVQEKLLKQQQPQPFQQLPVIWDKTQTLPYNCINNPPPHPPSTYIPVTAGHHSPLHFFLPLPPGAVGHPPRPPPPQLQVRGHLRNSGRSHAAEPRPLIPPGAVGHPLPAPPAPGQRSPVGFGTSPRRRAASWTVLVRPSLLWDSALARLRSSTAVCQKEINSALPFESSGYMFSPK